MINYLKSRGIKFIVRTRYENNEPVGASFVSKFEVTAARNRCGALIMKCNGVVVKNVYAIALVEGGHATFKRA